MNATIIIVNYNGGEMILRCLESLAGQVDPGRILIVDNASQDGSARVIRERFPTIRILPLRRNIGFGQAVNIGAARLPDTDFIITLNPDTICESGFVDALLAPFATREDLGMTAGVLTFATDPGIVASAGIDMHENGVALDHGLGESLAEVQTRCDEPFGASGGAAAYRLAAFHHVGGFPQSFFMYLEDVDLAWRMRLEGWGCALARNAIATHAYSASAGEGSPLKRRMLARNRIWTLARCLPSAQWRRHGLRIVRHDLLALGYGLATLDVASLRGRAEGILGLPQRLCERKRIQASSTVTDAEVATWLLPAVSPQRLLELRALTARLAAPRD